MKWKRLNDEIFLELDWLDKTIQEIKSLETDLENKIPTTREITAAASFLAQFYNGIENILKRIHQYNGIPLPQGDTWHIEILKRFCNPPFQSLPALFDDSLAADIAPYRKFRHIVHHGYGFQIEWSRMEEGVEKAATVFERFRYILLDYLKLIEDGSQ